MNRPQTSHVGDLTRRWIRASGNGVQEDELEERRLGWKAALAKIAPKTDSPESLRPCGLTASLLPQTRKCSTRSQSQVTGDMHAATKSAALSRHSTSQVPGTALSALTISASSSSASLPASAATEVRPRRGSAKSSTLQTKVRSLIDFSASCPNLAQPQGYQVATTASGTDARAAPPLRQTTPRLRRQPSTRNRAAEEAATQAVGNDDVARDSNLRSSTTPSRSREEIAWKRSSGHRLTASAQNMANGFAPSVAFVGSRPFALLRSASSPALLSSSLSSFAARSISTSAAGFSCSRRRLRVAIFNACAPGEAIHPAALSCMAAIAETPWFHSHAVDRLLDGECAPGGMSTVWTPPVSVDIVDSEDIRNGCLTNGLPTALGGTHQSWSNAEADDPETGKAFNILVVPGGSAAADSEALGNEGLDAIRSFVANGGTYLGVCAGAFLALSYENKKGSLGLVSATARMRDGCIRTAVQETFVSTTARMTSTDRDRTATSSCDESPLSTQQEQPTSPKQQDIYVSFTLSGRKYLWEEGRSAGQEPLEREGRHVLMRYSNGPLMDVWPRSSARVLATASPCDLDPRFGKEAPRTAVMVMEDFGSGRAVLISPHPESTQPRPKSINFATRSLLAAPGRAQPGHARLRRILQRAVLLAAAGSKEHRWLEGCSHVPIREALPQPD